MLLVRCRSYLFGFDAIVLIIDRKAVNEKGKYSRGGDAFIQTFHRQMSFCNRFDDRIARFGFDNSFVFELFCFIARWIYAFDADTSQDGPKKSQCFCNCDSDQRSEKIRVWNDNIALFYNSFCHALFHVFSSNSIVVVTNCCFAIVR